MLSSLLGKFTGSYYIYLVVALVVLGLLGTTAFFYQKTKTLQAKLEVKQQTIEKLEGDVKSLQLQVGSMKKNADELKVYYEKVIKMKEKQLKDVTKLCIGGTTDEKNQQKPIPSTGDHILDLLNSMFDIKANSNTTN